MFLFEGLFLGIAGAVVGCMAGGGLSGLINAFGGISMPPQPGMSSALRIFFTPGAKTFLANGIWVLAASTAGALFPGMLSSRKGIAELLRAR
jgi:putative ABC transport system permease protein